MADPVGEVAVFGRISYDLNPLQAETPLENVRTFERSVGGFAGNVATGLARLGVPTLVISGVGDDPHGRYVRRWLEGEGVDASGLAIHPTLRTSLAFYESWPPDRFPITLFRSPSAPDWELGPEDVPIDRAATAARLLLSGTGLAREASLRTSIELARRRGVRRPSAVGTVIDLDWRPMAWSDPTAYPGRLRMVLDDCDVIVGGDAEFAAAQLDPDAIATSGRVVVIKHGPDGATVLAGGRRAVVAGIRVPTTMGLGAGDAFLAAFVAGLFAGLDPADAARRGNAAGAIVASRPMCSPAMPTPAEIDRLRDGGLVVDGQVLEPKGGAA
jgi:5-dehydro-2-deoxygluconokinase